MSSFQIDALKLSTLTALKSGSHTSPEQGLCLLEAVAYVAGERHSDKPRCVNPVLGAFGRAVNDWMTDEERTRLVPLVAKLVGTRGDHELSLRRAMLLCDGAVRQLVPVAFDACGLTADATKLRELAKVEDEATAESAARSAARSAESAARFAARSAESAARFAARSAESAAWSAESAESAARSAWSAESAAESAARSAESAARSAESAARSAESARKQVVDATVALFEAAIEVGTK